MICYGPTCQRAELAEPFLIAQNDAIPLSFPVPIISMQIIYDIIAIHYCIIHSIVVSWHERGCACRAAKDMLDYIGTNAVGAHLVTRAFLPLLEGGSGKSVVNISSVAGSTTIFGSMVRLCC